MTAPEVLKFDLGAMMSALTKARGRSSEQVSQLRFNLTAMAEKRLPLTTHVLPSKRKKHVLDAEVWTPCGNRRVCSKKVSGAGSFSRCSTCGHEVYCSEACMKSDAEAHKKQCAGTATYGVRRVWPDLVSALDAYFGRRADLLRRGLKRFQYLQPFSSGLMKSGEEREKIEGIERWLAFQIVKTVYPVVPRGSENGGIRCMCCGKETSINARALRAIVTTEEDAQSGIEIEDTQNIGNVPELVRMCFVGAEGNGAVEGRFTLCCGEECHRKHNPMVHPFGVFGLWGHILNGNITFIPEYIQ